MVNAVTARARLSCPRGPAHAQIAKTVGLPDAHVRSLNMYNEGDTTHFGQVRGATGTRRRKGCNCMHDVSIHHACTDSVNGYALCTYERRLRG